jgi:nicotinamidase-related amidase
VNLVTLIRGLKLLGIPIFRTQQYTKGLGPTTAAVDEALSGVPVIEKISFSCWDEPVFREALSKSGRTQVILAGIEAHVCILQTAVDLAEQGYSPVVVEDCISSRKENDARAALMRLRAEGIWIATYESILFELCRYAGTDDFRKLLGLIK